MTTYPKSVDIIEVGPRDGFQNVKEFIETPHKEEIIFALLEAGLQEMELTSFVSPKAMPQMADAAQVAQGILAEKAGSFREIALAPNLRGAVNAWESGIHSVSFVISASESHNQSNVRRSTAESFENLKQLKAELPDMNIRLDLATAFGCPFEGAVPADRVVSMVERALECGVSEIVLCDTIGVANPILTTEICDAVRTRTGSVPVTLHMHDTRGMGLSNLIAGMQVGVTRFETAVGGLGGCPFAPGAAGNIATEDAVNMLQAMNIETGVDLDAYMKAVDLVKQYITDDLTSHMSHVDPSCAGVVVQH